jgi:hypothetical protein
MTEDLVYLAVIIGAAMRGGKKNGKRSQGHNPWNAQWMPLEIPLRRQP